MKILVLNSGSSSLKYQLFDMAAQVVLAHGLAERIGETGSRFVHAQPGAAGRDVTIPSTPIQDHAAAVERITDVLGQARLFGGDDDLAGIGHRVAHGGERFTGPVFIDQEVIGAIRELGRLAPLHNPANLLGIEIALAHRPDVPHVAVFDTAFHQTLPAHAYRYAVPEPWYAEHSIRRYGFHGTSHAYVARAAAAHLGQPIEALNLITLHLGNGASACAIRGGRSAETSMGLTPLEGLVMGTRSGDLDPAVIGHVVRESGQSLEQVEGALNADSGLVGLCGVGDLRDVLEREASGDVDAKLALDVYVHRIRKYVGAYTAVLGRVDALIFTAGVGENSPEIRQRVCQGLEALGIRVDASRNLDAKKGIRAVDHDESGVRVLVVPTNEELEIAEQTLRCVRAASGASD
jgi:acetate kinase